MKQTIKGKTYNTDTATLIASWDNGVGISDFSCCSEDLYKTKKGAYFIHGDGGPMSKYSISYGNTTTGGSNITLCDEDGALRWCEEHKMEREINKFFDHLIEDA